MTAVSKVMRYRLQGRSEGVGPGMPVTPPPSPFGRLFISKMDNIQYLGGEKAQIWRSFNTLAPKTTVKKLTVEICFPSKYSRHDDVLGTLGVTLCDPPPHPLKNPGYAPVVRV